MQTEKAGETASPAPPMFGGASSMKGFTGIKASRMSHAAAAMLGMAVPVAAGAATGHGQIGVLASLGALALSGDGEGDTFRAQFPGLAYALAATSTAMLTGSMLAGRGPAAALAVPVIAGAAGLLGGLSRPLARAAVQFILFTVIAAHLGAGEIHPAAKTFVFLAGAAWTAFLSLSLRPIFQAFMPSPANPPAAAAPPRYTMKQLIARWRRSFAQFSGWQYTLRIVLCLAAAEALVLVWPYGHGYWIAITVAIVVHRNLSAALPRALERAGGTVGGVLLCGALMFAAPSAWGLIATIAVLAALRPLLREANYTVYAAVMTPLVILLLDYGQALSVAVVMDRLVATLAGCALALTLGYLAWLGFLPGGRERLTVSDTRRR